MNYRNKHMTTPRSRFYKGLTGFTAGTEEEIYEIADNSIYRWWWEFMRLSPIFWYAGKTGHQPIKDSMAKTDQSAGNFKLISFNDNILPFALKSENTAPCIASVI